MGAKWNVKQYLSDARLQQGGQHVSCTEMDAAVHGNWRRRSRVPARHEIVSEIAFVILATIIV
jgi:hypothetical protein